MPTPDLCWVFFFFSSAPGFALQLFARIRIKSKMIFQILEHQLNIMLKKKHSSYLSKHCHLFSWIMTTCLTLIRLLIHKDSCRTVLESEQTCAHSGCLRVCYMLNRFTFETYFIVYADRCQANFSCHMMSTSK